MQDKTNKWLHMNANVIQTCQFLCKKTGLEIVLFKEASVDAAGNCNRKW